MSAVRMFAILFTGFIYAPAALAADWAASFPPPAVASHLSRGDLKLMVVGAEKTTTNPKASEE